MSLFSSKRNWHAELILTAWIWLGRWIVSTNNISCNFYSKLELCTAQLLLHSRIRFTYYTKVNYHTTVQKTIWNWSEPPKLIRKDQGLHVPTKTMKNWNITIYKLISSEDVQIELPYSVSNLKEDEEQLIEKRLLAWPKLQISQKPCYFELYWSSWYNMYKIIFTKVWDVDFFTWMY